MPLPSPVLDLQLRLMPAPMGTGYRVVLQAIGQDDELAAENVPHFSPERLEKRYLAPLRAFIDRPVAPELLHGLGVELAGLLLPGQVRAVLTAQLAACSHPADRLRLRLYLQVSELAGLPWEFVHLDEQTDSPLSGFLSLHPRLHLVRQSAVLSPVEPVEADPLRVLIACADPRSAAYPALPHLEAEVKSVTAELNRAPMRRRVETERLRATTPAGLQQGLAEWCPHVLHFIGHGDARALGGFLVLEGDRTGTERIVYADELANWLVGTPVRLVVLSACRTASAVSGVAQALCEQEIAAVVAMQLPLRDTAARAFARAFYGALVEPCSVEEAVFEARQAVQGYGPDWGVPVLYLAGASSDLFRLPEAVTSAAPVPLPTGTVTFLFTDIEGSTERWQKYRQEMPEALARHNHVVRRAIERHGGYVFKTVGDGFCAVFADPSNGLIAALEAQRALLEQDWSAVGGLRVRMALHTGMAELQDDDYFGVTLSRVDRILNVGHGGQVLVSQTTYELVKDQLPEEASLQDRGPRRLKDLREPERIFQLLHPALPTDLLPLRSLDELPNNLPLQLTSFIGREAQMEETRRLLDKTRLLTLTGVGGCGKTRLALQVAAEMLDAYEDGVWLVELAALSDPALVPQAVASALSVQEEPGRPLTETLADTHKPKTLLLLLDNCEHLLPACASLANVLLRACPKIRILATSRKRLGLIGELSYSVPPMGLPDPKRLPPLQELSQYEAVRLFIERAAFRQPGFAPTPQNAEAVAQVCRRLDGIPLTIELAAARLNVLSVDQIARFNDYFKLLSDKGRTAAAHQKTLQATLDWSYDLLTEPERSLLQRLSMFAGGCTLEAAQAVCSGDGIDEWELLDLLSQLVDASLVVAEEQEGDKRYRLLETIRQYASNRLEKCGHTNFVHEKHLSYFLAFAEEAERRLQEPEQAEWLNRLEREHDNLRAALTWSSKSMMYVQLTGALWLFWYMRGYISEGRHWLEGALSRSEDIESALRARVLNGAGVLAMVQGDYATAQTTLEESLAICRQSSNLKQLAASLNNLGNIALILNNYAGARSFYEEGVGLQRQLGNLQGTANTLLNLGVVARGMADYRAAREFFEASLSQYKQLNNIDGMAKALTNLGVVCCDEEDYSKARAYYEESLTLRRVADDKWNVAMLFYNLGEVTYKQGDSVQARAFFEESLKLTGSLGDRDGAAHVLVYLAVMAAGQHDYRRAARLLGIDDGLRAATGTQLEPNVRMEHEKVLADTRAKLSENAFQTAWAEGRAMSLEQAIDYALGQPDI